MVGVQDYIINIAVWLKKLDCLECTQVEKTTQVVVRKRGRAITGKLSTIPLHPLSQEHTYMCIYDLVSKPRIPPTALKTLTPEMEIDNSVAEPTSAGSSPTSSKTKKRLFSALTSSVFGINAQRQGKRRYTLCSELYGGDGGKV